MTVDRSVQRLVRRASGTGWRARRAQRVLVDNIRRTFSPIDRLLSAVLVESYIEEGVPAPRVLLTSALPKRVWREEASALPQSVVDTLCDDALSPDSVWSELRAFCVDRELVPSDETRRAMFLCVTEQWAPLRVLDPDGALLMASYAEARPGRQRQIVDAVLSGGDPHLVRALVDTVCRSVIVVGRWRLPDTQLGYLMSGLAKRGAWPDLWDLIKGGPILHVRDDVRLLREWRPRATAERALVERLVRRRTIDEHWEISLGLDVTVPPKASQWIAPAGTRTGSAEIIDVSFGPDRPEMAVAWRSRYNADVVRITVMNVRNHRLFACDHRQVGTARVLHLGGSIIVAGGNGITRYRLAGSDSTLGGTTLCTRPSGSAGLVPLGGGFATDSEGDLLIALEGASVRAVPSASLGLAGPILSIAAEPDGTRIAAASATGLAVTDTEGRMVARATVSGPHRLVAFFGLDCLITHCDGELHRWSTAGDALHREVTASLLHDRRGPHTPVALPAHRRLVAALPNGPGLVYYDVDTLDEISGPFTFTPEKGKAKKPGMLVASRSGRYLAVVPANQRRDGIDPHGLAGVIDLYDSVQDEIAALINRPMADMEQTDKDRVKTLCSFEHEPYVADMLDQLHAFLTHQFASVATPIPFADAAGDGPSITPVN
jgi:hypothetical protein